MGYAKSEAELADRLKTFLRAEVAKSEMTYEEFAKEMRKHGLKETKASVTNKLARGTFPATFLLGALAALERPSLSLEDV